MKEKRFLIHHGFNDIYATPLIAAIANKDIELTKKAIITADPLERDSHNNSILFWAHHAQDKEILEILYKNNFLSVYNNCEILMAATSSLQTNDDGVITFWLEKYNSLYIKNKWDFLSAAVIGCNHAYFSIFISDPTAFDINYQRDTDFFSLLHIAADLLRIDFIKALLNAGANPNLKNVCNEAPAETLKHKKTNSKHQEKIKNNILKIFDEFNASN